MQEGQGGCAMMNLNSEFGKQEKRVWTAMICTGVLTVGIVVFCCWVVVKVMQFIGIV